MPSRRSSRWKDQMRVLKYQRNYPLHAAAARGDIRMVKRCLDIRYNCLCTCIACIWRPLCLTYYPERGRVNSRDVFGKTALHYSIERIKDWDKRFTMCKYLLQRRADVDMCDSNNRTALFKAVTINDLDLVETLLEYGADPNVQSSSGATVLSEAISNRNREMMELLLDYKAKVNDSFAIYMALLKNDEGILKIMHEYGADMSKFDFTSNVCSSRNVAELLEKMVDLHFAESVEFLLENGVHVNISRALEIAFGEYRSSFLRPRRDKRYFVLERILLAILKYVIILLNYDLTSPERILQVMGTITTIEEDYESFVRQVHKMRTMKVHENAHFTFFDLLTKKGDALSELCSDKTIAVLSGIRPRETFPDFTEMLRRNVQRGMKARRAKDEVNDKKLNKIFGRTLPLDLIDEEEDDDVFANEDKDTERSSRSRYLSETHF